MAGVLLPGSGPIVRCMRVRLGQVLEQPMPMTRKWVACTVRRTVGAVSVALLPVACGGSGKAVAPAWPMDEPWPKDEIAVAAAVATPGRSWVGAYLAGHHALHTHDFKAASAYYRQALEIDPTNVNLLKRTYTLLAAEGNVDDSVVVVERLQPLQKREPVATIILAVGAARNEDYAEVERLMTELPRHGLNSFVGPLMVAWAQVGQGRINAALETVASLKKSDHLSTLYHFHSGMINDLADRPLVAAAHYEITLTTEGGVSLRAIEIIGAFYLRTGQRDKARALYERSLKIYPRTVLLDDLIQGLRYDGTHLTGGTSSTLKPIKNARTGLAETLFGAATTIREENATDASLLFARLALAVQADFPLAQVLVGDILQSQVRPYEASVLYRTIGRDAVIHYPAQLRVADSLYKAGDLGGAMSVLETLTRQWPERPEALIEWGDMLRHEKRFAEAAVTYEKAFARIPVVASHHWSLFYSRGIAYERSQQWSAAERDFLKALELEPNHPLILNYLGYSWLERRINLDRARDMIRRAVHQRPEDGFIVDSLGWALYLSGDYRGAVRELERSVELEPNDSTINDHLGDAYWQVGRYKEAHFQWLRALSLSSEELSIRETIHRKLEQGLEPVPADAGSSQ